MGDTTFSSVDRFEIFHKNSIFTGVPRIGPLGPFKVQSLDEKEIEIFYFDPLFID